MEYDDDEQALAVCTHDEHLRLECLGFLYSRFCIPIFCRFLRLVYDFRSGLGICSSCIEKMYNMRGAGRLGFESM